MKAQAFLDMLELGFSVIPVDIDKRPTVSWKPYQSRLATEIEVGNWVQDDVKGVAVVCGRISGGLVCIDIDKKHDPRKNVELKFLDSIIEAGLQEIYLRCIFEQTKSRGYHIVFRTAMQIGNEKLARGEGKVEAMIETRGEGGYFVCAPTPGWVLLRNGFDSVPYLEEADAKRLIECARCLDQGQTQKTVQIPARKFYGEKKGVGVGGDFNARVALEQMVEFFTSEGWKVVKTTRHYIQIQRPGKSGRELSGSIAMNCAVKIFSTSTNLETDRAMTPFGAYTFLKHGGDFRAASKSLYAMGFGVKLCR